MEREVNKSTAASPIAWINLITQLTRDTSSVRNDSLPDALDSCFGLMKIWTAFNFRIIRISTEETENLKDQGRYVINSIYSADYITVNT